jgi:aspartate/tyrosine/aromatic aminotransferase
MMMAFVLPGLGGREVTRAKNDMSVFMRGHGRFPLSPIPRRVVVSSVA